LTFPGGHHQGFRFPRIIYAPSSFFCDRGSSLARGERVGRNSIAEWILIPDSRVLRNHADDGLGPCVSHNSLSIRSLPDSCGTHEARSLPAPGLPIIPSAFSYISQVPRFHPFLLPLQMKKSGNLPIVHSVNTCFNPKKLDSGLYGTRIQNANVWAVQFPNGFRFRFGAFSLSWFSFHFFLNHTQGLMGLARIKRQKSVIPNTDYQDCYFRAPTFFEGGGRNFPG